MLEKKFQINNLHFYHKKLKKEQIKSNASEMKGKIKIRAEINEIYNKIMKKISKTKS